MVCKWQKVAFAPGGSRGYGDPGSNSGLTVGQLMLVQWLCWEDGRGKGELPEGGRDTSLAGRARLDSQRCSALDVCYRYLLDLLSRRLGYGNWNLGEKG